MKIIWIALSMFMVGCTVTKPHVTEYTLSPNVKNQEQKAHSCKTKSLKVGQVFSSNSLMTQKMKYIEVEYRESAFTQSKWARTPNRAISDELVKSIRNSTLFANVSSFKSRAKSDLVLETNVEKFMQYFDEDGEKSYVEVVVTMNLLNAKDSKIVSSFTSSISVDTLSADAKGGVVALNSALSQVLLQTNEWLAKVCK